MAIRNEDYLRSLNSKEFPGFGAKLVEAFKGVVQSVANVAQQVNGNGTGQPSAPPAINGVRVAAQNGHFQVSIQDQGPIFRGVRYYVEHADNPHFTDPHVVRLGDSRNANIYLGNVTRYFRAYSAYASSPAGPPAYHGSQAQPLAVTGGGIDPGPAFLASEGSGTGGPGQGLQGPGAIPFRSTTGAAPTR